MPNCIVVDDDIDSLNVFCELLEFIDVTVLARGMNGKDAEILYEKYKPDVIFLDLLMPEYDGFYAIERIFDMDKNAKIVVVTGDLKTGESYLLDTYNVAAVINKPFDMSVVKQVLVDIFLI